MSELLNVGHLVPKLALHAPGFVVLNRKNAYELAPLGLAVPLKVTELDVTSVAASVVTLGASSVVKDSTDPKPVPSALCTMAQ